jgi:hypothetical protein
MYVDSIIHPFHLFPPSIFGFQMLKRKQCVSANDAGPSPLVDHRVCSKEVKIIICDIDILQDNLVQKVDKSVRLPHALTRHVRLQFSLSMFLQYSFVSLWVLIILKILWLVVLMKWYDISLSVVGGYLHVVHPGQHVVHQKCL